MKILLLGLSLTLMLILSGCATTISLKPSVRQQIHSVSISKIVTPAKNMYMDAPGADVGAAFGIVGEIARESIDGVAISDYQRAAKKYHIHLKTIVRNEFIQAFKQQHPFQLKNKNADAELFLYIKQYGYEVGGISGTFSGSVRPVLKVQALMVRDKKIVWQQDVSTGAAISDMPTKDMHAIFSNKKLINQLWSVAAREVSQQLVAKLDE